MAAPLSGTEVPCGPQSDESPKGDRPSPAGTTELAAAEASAGVSVATIAPLAPVERGGGSGVENSRRRCLTAQSTSSAVCDGVKCIAGTCTTSHSQPSVSPEILKLEELVGKPIRGGITSAHCRAHFRSAPFFQTLSNGICQIA